MTLSIPYATAQEGASSNDAAGYGPAAIPTARGETMQAAYYYDGATRDWLLGDDDRLKALDPVEQGVAFAVLWPLTNLGGNVTVGNTCNLITDLSNADRVQADVESRLALAEPLATYVKNGQVVVSRIVTSVDMTSQRLTWALYFSLSGDASGRVRSVGNLSS